MTALTVGAGKSTRTAAQSASSLIRNGNSGASNTLNNPKLAQFNGKSVPLDAHVPTNPFLNDFVDCIENLPNRLQILLTELRSLDVQVKARHRKLQLLKQEIVSRTTSEQQTEHEKTSNEPTASSSVQSNEIDVNIQSMFKALSLDQLLNKLHQLLIQCQSLGDQKVKLTGQIMETLGSKTRQLGLDAKTNDKRFQLELDEEKILTEFKMAIKKNRTIHLHHHHYSTGSNTNGATGSRSSTRFSNNNLNNHNQAASAGAGAFSSAKTKQINSISTKYGINNNRNNVYSNSAVASGDIIDAYSFNDDQPNNLSSSPFASYNNGNDKLLRNSNSINYSGSVMNGLSSSKKKNLRNNKEELTSSVNGKLNKAAGAASSVKKIKLDANGASQAENKLSNKNNINDTTNENQSTLTRSKRQLNYNSTNLASSNSSSQTSILNTKNSLSISNSIKKRRLNQLKPTSNQNQCKSPSSSSTSSTITSTNKSNRLNTLNTRLNNAKQQQALAKDTKNSKLLTNKTNKLKLNSSANNVNMLNKKKNNVIKSKRGRRLNKSTHNQDNDADDDDSDNENPSDKYNYNDSNEEDEEMRNEMGDEDENDSDSIRNNDENNERNSNETESINHIDDDEDMMDTNINSDNQLDDENEVEEDEELDELNPATVNGVFHEAESKAKTKTEENNENENYKNDKENNMGLELGAKGTNDDENNSDITAANTASAKKKSIRSSNKNNSETSLSNVEQKSDAKGLSINKSSINPDEPVYCTCREISYGQMICCDNDACKIEWFHFECVKLANKPKGKWYCPECRGDTHKVMKKAPYQSSPSYYSSTTAASTYSYRNK